jgi:hypothetical protein
MQVGRKLWGPERYLGLKLTGRPSPYFPLQQSLHFDNDGPSLPPFATAPALDSLLAPILVD